MRSGPTRLPVSPSWALMLVAISCGGCGPSDQDPLSELDLVLEKDVTPASSMAHRPDVVAMDGVLYLAYAQQEPSPQRFRLLRLDTDALQLGEPVDLFSGTGLATDIRVAADGGGFWYGFETFDLASPDGCDHHFLGGAIYTLVGDDVQLAASVPDLTTGCPTTPEFMQNPPTSMPENPKVADDPTPFVHQDTLYLLARAWSREGDGWYHSVQHVFGYDREFNETSSCLLDLAPALGGNEWSLSQNTLVVIEEQVYLIGGFSSGPPAPGFSSGIYAVPLSNDLCSVAGPMIPIVQGDEYATRVTASRYANGLLYANYLVKGISGDSSEDQGYLAVLDARHSFELVDEVLFQEHGVVDSHSSFEVLDGKVYVFYQGDTERLLLRVFE